MSLLGCFLLDPGVFGLEFDSLVVDDELPCCWPSWNFCLNAACLASEAYSSINSPLFKHSTLINESGGLNILNKLYTKKIVIFYL